MLCDDAVDFLEIGKDHIADDAVLDGCHGVAVLQHFLTVVMSQVTVESAGDVGVTASDPVDHIDAVVRRFTVVAVFGKAVAGNGDRPQCFQELCYFEQSFYLLFYYLQFTSY